jgi:hypothetical protein
MHFNIEELQIFINQHEIPKIKGKPKTFLGIAKQPHYENVLSNIYAFYFNVNEVHEFKDLFVTSLLELINKDAKHIVTFFDFDVFTEYGVSDQKRIDLLLQNKEQAIIIENKVYHHLNNDLHTYYNEVKAITKVGVVLSLHPIANINPPHFINITHLQLLNRVMDNLGNYLLNGNDKYVVFLKDFYQNTINLTQPIMEENDFNFYFEHQNKINQLIKYKVSIRKYIENEVKKSFYNVENDGLNLKINESSGNLGNCLTYFVSKLNKDLMFTIIYDKLLKSDRTLELIIELKGNALNNKERYRGITVLGEENTRFFESKRKNYEHFVCKTYKLEQSQIRTLGDVIFNKLKEDGLIDAFTKIENVLKL